MEKLIEQFLEHLRYERNVSSHTLRNYASDLEQFLDFLAPSKNGQRALREISAIDHLTIRECWLRCTRRKRRKPQSRASSPHCAPSFSFWCAKGCSTSIPPNSFLRLDSRKNFRSISRSTKQSGLSSRPIRKQI